MDIRVLLGMLYCKYLPDHCLHLLFRVDLHFHKLKMRAKQQTKQPSEDEKREAQNIVIQQAT